MSEKYIGQKAYDLMAKECFETLKTKIGQTELENAISKLTSGLAWKGVFNTLQQLNEKIPSPKEGDFVIITQEPSYNNKNTLLIYEAESVNSWQTVGELFLPSKATQSQDGLMSKEDKQKLDNIREYVLPIANVNTLGGVKAKNGSAITIGLDGSIDIESTKLIQSQEREKWNKASDDSSSALNKATMLETTIQNIVSEEEAKQIIDKYKE